MADRWKDQLQVGQKVRFSPTHNKDITFTGTILAIHEGAADCVDVKSDAENGSVSRLYTAHAADVRVTDEKSAPAKPNKSGKKKGNGNGAKKEGETKINDGTAQDKAGQETAGQE